MSSLPCPRRPHLATAALALALASCGAKTGLRVPTRDAATDAASNRRCVIVNPDVGTQLVDLDTRARVSVADVVLLVDHTSSMSEELLNIRDNLRDRVVPAITAAIPNAFIGVATYADFPLEPYGNAGDRVFTVGTEVTADLSRVDHAVNMLRLAQGGDLPESATEALYHLATGEAYGPWTRRPPACTPRDRVGPLCLRPDAQPIVVLVTDAASHNGTEPGHDYDPTTFMPPATRPPHSYREAVDALRRARARVVGIRSDVNPEARADLEALARDTGAVTPDGRPLVFDIGADGAGLDARVVDAIRRYVTEVRLDVSARLVDLDPRAPASAVVRALRPASAVPASQVDRMDATTFYGVVPGTRLVFAIEIDTRAARRGPEPRRLPARVEFVTDGAASLGSTDVDIVIPAEDGRGC